MEHIMTREKARDFLRQCELFASLPDEALDRVLETCSVQNHGPGSVIFRPDDPSDRIYIIKSGVVEISRKSPDTGEAEIATYLGERETLGEMSIFTESPRSSMARVPERAELLVISRKAFMGLMEETPVLAIKLASVLAMRLEAWIMKQRIQIKGQELSGSLEYFDPSTLIQTLAHNDRTGLLTIVGEDGEPVAEVSIEEGEVCSARLGHLTGAEAFYQIFQSFDGKTFTFKVGHFDRVGQKERIPYGTMALLFEANRLQDELKELKKRIPEANTVFLPKAHEFSWKDEATAPLAKEVWDLIVLGEPLHSILKKVPVSHYSVYSIVSQMLSQGRIAF
jgi:CRP-like cAMP-binding protein